MAIANKVLPVVAAAIFNKQGDLLIAQRPLDKYMSGLWGFPGGKVEADEAVTDALCRELDEELGIQPLSWESLICIEHAYPEKTVLPDVWIVKDFHGEAHSRERQAVRWLHPMCSISLNFLKPTTASLRRSISRKCTQEISSFTLLFNNQTLAVSSIEAVRS